MLSFQASVRRITRSMACNYSVARRSRRLRPRGTFRFFAVVAKEIAVLT